ncbi:MAG TPA: AAA family ATPase, partial [Firmicutes bacterium]|nr:AAA family ATPase [Bacillota bacterium]
MAKTLQWEKLVLRGFGRFQGEVVVAFSPGLNHAVAPNEQGKSTLVAGLTAVLFGLPGLSDPTKFGKARYRNWHNPDRFEGELTFRVDGVLYRVERDFESDRVVLSRQEGTRWVQLAGGEHRALARKRNLTYEEALADLIGITTVDLFAATFCVGQPLPEADQLSHSVQQLLAGAGATGAEALARLEEQLGEITRFTGRLGVTSRDKNKDRELERLQEEKRNLEQAVKESAAGVDAQHALAAELAALEEEKEKRAAELSAKQNLYHDWGRWRLLRDRYESALAEQVKLAQAQQEAQRLSMQLAEVKDTLAREYGEFLGAPPDVKDKLDVLLATEEQIKELERARAALVERQAAAENEMAALRAQLEGPLAAVRDRPHLVQEHEELRQELAEKEKLSERLAELERQAEKARRAQESLEGWAALGEQPLTAYRRAAQAAVEKYEELQTLERTLAARRAELADEYGCFLSAGPELLVQVRDYHTLLRRREERQARAAAALQEAEEKLARHQEAEAKLAQQFADVADLPGESVALLERKLALAEEEKRWEEKPAAGRRSLRMRGCWLAGAALAVVALLLWTGGRSPGFALGLLAAGAALGLYGYVAGRRPSQPSGERQRRQAELAALDAQLGPLADRPLAQLAALRERVRLREERRRELAAEAEGLPTAAEVAARRA